MAFLIISEVFIFLCFSFKEVAVEKIYIGRFTDYMEDFDHNF